MFIRFKSEHLYVMVVYEGVHEEVYLGSVIRAHLHEYNIMYLDNIRINMYNT